MSNTLLALKIKKKGAESELEEAFLNQYKCLFLITETLVEQSKLHITSDEAIERIRKYMNENL